jgi:hypothetical protein
VANNSAHKFEYLEGETFDMTGLVIEMIYDDYSVDVADASQLSLKTTNALSSLTRYVVVSCNGKDVRVSVTVNKVEGENPDLGGGEDNNDSSDSTDSSVDSSTDSSVVDESSSEKDGCGSVVGGGIVVMAALLAMGVVVLKSKKQD